MKTLKVILWSFVAVTAALTFGFSIWAISTQPSSSGPPAPLDGVATLIIMGVLAGSLVTGVLCWKFFPRDSFSFSRLGISILLYTVVVGGFYTSLQESERQTITIQFLDHSGSPVADLNVEVEIRRLGGGIGVPSSSEYTTETDEKGEIVVQTDNRDSTMVTVVSPDFPEAAFSCDRRWGSDRKQAGFGWLDPTVDYSMQRGTKGENQRGFYGFLPTDREVSISIFLPQSGVDIMPPLPQGDWLKIAQQTPEGN